MENKCPYCSKELDTDWMYESGMYNMEKEDILRQECPFCGNKFNIIAELTYEFKQLYDDDDV